MGATDGVEAWWLLLGPTVLRSDSLLDVGCHVGVPMSASHVGEFEVKEEVSSQLLEKGAFGEFPFLI